MLADEAHHLNSSTKKQTDLDFKEELTNKTNKEEIERKGWKHTIIELILNKNNPAKENNNVLLEFTATIPETKEIAEKYANKIIYKFGLKEFLEEISKRYGGDKLIKFENLNYRLIGLPFFNKNNKLPFEKEYQ